MVSVRTHIVTRVLGKLEARRHFTSGSAAACARLNVGIIAAPAATPAPADFRNFLRSMIRSSGKLGLVIWVGASAPASGGKTTRERRPSPRPSPKEREQTWDTFSRFETPINHPRLSSGP